MQVLGAGVFVGASHSSQPPQAGHPHFFDHSSAFLTHHGMQVLGAGVFVGASFLKSTLRPRMCEERLKLARFGKTSASCDSSTPIHSAIGTIIVSQGYFGMSLPRPASCGFPSSKDAGNSLKTWPPFTPPPSTK